MRSNEFKPTEQEFNRLPAGHCGQHTPSECIGMLTVESPVMKPKEKYQVKDY